MAAPLGRDQLAARFADKLAKAPAKGTRPQRSERASPPPNPSAARRPVAKSPPPSAPKPPIGDRPAVPRRRPSPDEGQPLRRGSEGAVVRGHLVPRAVHSAARRAAVRAGAQRGRRVTWDVVMSEALDVLDRRTALARIDPADGGRRGDTTMVQATITAEQDLTFAELRLDVADALGVNVRFEQLWAVALELWTEQVTGQT